MRTNRGGVMRTIGITEARKNLPDLIRRVEAGEEIVLLRRGKEVATLVPPVRKRSHLPNLKEFRASIEVESPLSESVIDARSEERY